MIDKEKIKLLGEKANGIRISVIEMLVEAGSGHAAGSLSVVDILTALYFHILKHDPKRPDWPEGDRLVLSHGHTCPALYAALAQAGYFPVEELKTLRRFGSRLQGHPHREFLPMIETSSGPLGEGLAQAAGMALADKMDGFNELATGGLRNRRVFCLLSDGEMNAGGVWEAAMFAAKEQLGNLIAIVDKNGIQADGFTEQVMPLGSLTEKWRAWGWRAREIDGHNFGEIIEAVEEAKNAASKPSVIIAHTVPGKGVKEIEGDPSWHGRAPTPEEKKNFLAELYLDAKRPKQILDALDV